MGTPACTKYPEEIEKWLSPNLSYGAVLHEAGRLAGAASIVTRDRPGFAAAVLRVYDPETLLAALDASK